MTQPHLCIATLGGTLSMHSGHAGNGIIPQISGQALVNTVPGLSDLARLHVESLSLVPSGSLDFDFLLSVVQWASRQIEQGARGVVVTQGTDTLEETATFFDYLWPHDEPLVITGAMRSAGHVGADGPANLLDACRVALSEASRKRGVLVVMNSEVHEALHVRKNHTLAVQAFSSPNVGPVGWLIEERVRYLRPAAARWVMPWPNRTSQAVALLEATLSADTRLLEQLLHLGYEGVVIAGLGAGHVSEHWANALAPIAAKIPVIVGSRTGAGETARQTYGFSGGEMDLISKGLHMSAGLCPRKARVLLWLLVGAGLQGQVEQWLAR